MDLIPEIDYQIMVQRATQVAIWAMPAVGIIDIEKAIIVYSMESKGFIIDAPVVGLSANNKDTLQFNEDGSADIYFAPEAPQGMESNWIPTGEDFFLLFRLYGPQKPLFEKTWQLPDVEKVN